MGASSGDMKEKLRLLLPFIVGYALLDAWSQTVFSTSFFAQTSPSDQIFKSVSPLIPAFVFLLVSGRIRQLVRRRYREVLYLFGAAASAGTGLLLFVMYGALDSQWTKVTLSLLAMARMCLIICWWERLAVFQTKDMWLALGCAIGLGGFLSMIPAFVPDAVRNCLVVIAPLVSTMLLPIRFGRNDEAPCPAFEAPNSNYSLGGMVNAIPWMLVMVLGLMNIPSEALVYLEMISDTTATIERDPFFSALTRMMVNLTALLLAYLAVRINIGLAFFVAVPAVIVLAFLLELGVDVSFNNMHSICRIGSELVRYIIVYLLLTSIKQRQVPPLFCFSFMTLIHCAGSALGVLIAFTLQDNRTIIAMLFMGILLVAMLFVIGDMQRHGPLSATRRTQEDTPETDLSTVTTTTQANNPTLESTEEITPQQNSSQIRISETSTDIIEAFAQRYGLTLREREVLELWVRGRTAAYIEEQLCISKYTVKTHVNHIYEKTGVNSKEDLISLTEAFTADYK